VDDVTSLLNTGLTACVLTCQADEYKDMVLHKCIKCNSPGGDWTYCTSCSNATTCKTCSEGKCLHY